MAERDIRIRIRVQVTNLTALKELSTVLKQAAAAEKQMGKGAAEKNKSLRAQVKGVQEDEKATRSLSGTLRKLTQDIIHNVTKVMEWAIATGIVYAAIRQLGESAADVEEVDFAIAGLTKVMNDAGDRSRRLAADVQVLASVYGEMGDSLIEATTEWARLQGSNLEIIEGTKAAMLAQAVAEMEVTDATRLLVAELKQFEQPILRAVRLIDQWNELSNTFAVRAVDIAQAAARAGGVMHNMGVEMERLHGYTTALVQSTGRAGEAIGTALRTIATYTYRMETMSSLARLANVSITDLTGTQMTLGQILDRIAMNWGTFTDATQKAVAQTMAGTRRVNEFITLMEQYPVALEATVKAWRSVGSAQKEAEVFMDTIRKQLDRTRSLMQRLVTEGGLLAATFKLIIVQANNFIRGLITLRPLIAAVVAGLVAMKVASYLAVVPLKLLVFQARNFIFNLHPLASALVALGVVLGATITLFGYLANRQDEAIQKAKDIRDAAYANARALRAEADQLKFLTDAYERHIETLQQAAAEPGLYSPQQVERMRDNLKKLGAELERLTGVSFADIDVAAGNWVETLDKVREKLQDVDDAATKSFGDQQKALDAAYTSQKRIVDFWTLLSAKLEEIPKGPEGLGMRFGAVAQAAREAGLAVREIGGYRLFQTEGFDRVSERLKDAKADLLDIDNMIRGLTKDADKMAEVLTDEDIEDMFTSLEAQLNSLEAEYGYLTARFKFAGKSQTELAELALDGINEQIAAVEKLAQDYKEVDKIQTDAAKMLNRLYKEREQLEYAIIQAGWVDNEKKLNDQFTKQIAALKSQSQYLVRYKTEVGGLVAGSQARIQAYKNEIAAYKEQIKYYEKMRWNTETLEKSLSDLNLRVEQETNLLNSIYRPAEEYAVQVERLNTATERATILMQARRESQVAIAQLEVDAAKRMKDMARTDDERRAADQALKLSEARLQAAIISEKYAKATEEIDRVLEHDMAIMQATGASAVVLASRQVQAAEERLRATQELSDEVQSLAKADLAAAQAAYNLAVISQRNVDIAGRRQIAAENLTMSHQAEINSLKLLGATDERITQLQIEHAKEVLQNTIASQKAYSGMVEWALAVLGALQKVRAAEAALAGARLTRIRTETQEEFAILQDQHDHRIDLMQDLGRSTREQVEERIRQLSEEMDFVVTAQGLTDEQRLEMSKALYGNLIDLSRDYERDEVQRAYNIADAYVSQYLRIENQWYDTVAKMASDSPLDAVLQQLDSIYGDWAAKQAKKTFGPLIEKLTGIQVEVAGLSPAEMRAETQRQQMMVDAMLEGSDYLKGGMIDASDYLIAKLQTVFDRARAIMTGDVGEGVSLPNELSDAFGSAVTWLRGVLESGAQAMGIAIERGGEKAGDAIEEGAEQGARKGAEGAGGGATVTGKDWLMGGYGLLRGLNINDWVRERGGGWRGAGYGVGATIGFIAGQGNPLTAALGAQIGQEIVSKGQDLWNWIKGDAEDEMRRPRTESLREQLSGIISRGQFREAANITYNIQNSYHFDYFWPDPMQVRRVAAALHEVNQDYTRNVTAGR